MADTSPLFLKPKVAAEGQGTDDPLYGVDMDVLLRKC